MSKIESICNQIVLEATAIINTSNEIDNLLRSGEGKAADLLDEIRIDGVAHIQKLAVALTKCFFEKCEAETPEVTSVEAEEVEANG